LFREEGLAMAEAKLVRVCKKCSGFNVDELKGLLKAKDYSTGCIGRCLGGNPALKGKVYGFLAGKFTVCASKAEFLAKAAKLAPAAKAVKKPAAKKAAPKKAAVKKPAARKAPAKKPAAQKAAAKGKK
jgi:hypothetical protein